MSKASYFWFVGLSLILVGCGGGESRPGPLKHHFDDMYIAQVPMDGRPPMTEPVFIWQTPPE